MILGVIVTGAVGIVCAVLGVLLWKKEKINILHDYHVDKVREAGLILEDASVIHTPGVRQYPLTLECRILYAQDQDLNLIPENIRSACYPQDVPGTHPMANRDCHTMYVGEIEAAYIIRDGEISAS